MMKKLRLMIMICVSFFVFSACGTSMERDAKKMAERAVEFEQTQRRFGHRSNLYGKPMSRAEYEQYTKEYIEFSNEMLAKYSETLEMQREFTEMVNKEIEKLK